MLGWRPGAAPPRAWRAAPAPPASPCPPPSWRASPASSAGSRYQAGPRRGSGKQRIKNSHLSFVHFVWDI